MLQQQMLSPGNIEIHEVLVPTIEADEVLIEIKRIGVCGSDIHVYHGKHPYVNYPLTQGHEVSGKVVSIGNLVTHLYVGQKVTIEPQEYCGECYPCKHGKYNLCENLKVMGFQTLGSASEYFKVKGNKVVGLPASMTYDEGAMIEPLAVTLHACTKAGDVIDKAVIILGAGPIGILLCQTLKALGAAKVMMTDISDHRLEIAKLCGADIIVNTKTKDLSSAIDEYFGNDKADLIFDCAGNNITIGQAIENARKGSKIILVAVFSSLAVVDLAKLNDSELDILTSMMYRHEDYVEAIRLVDEGLVKLKPLMSRHFYFGDYDKAYKYIEENSEKTMKVLIDIAPSLE